jgi:uncharacterized membrane protein YadS
MATIVKLFRVAMLPVVLIAVVLVLRAERTGAAGGSIPLLPWFMVLFLALVVLGSTVDLPTACCRAGRAPSRAPA